MVFSSRCSCLTSIYFLLDEVFNCEPTVCWESIIVLYTHTHTIIFPTCRALRDSVVYSCRKVLIYSHYSLTSRCDFSYESGSSYSIFHKSSQGGFFLPADTSGLLIGDKFKQTDIPLSLNLLCHNAYC